MRGSVTERLQPPACYCFIAIHVSFIFTQINLFALPRCVLIMCKHLEARVNIDTMCVGKYV